jgi:hypothetical protein
MLEHAPLALCALALFGCGQPRVAERVPLSLAHVAPSDGATGVDPSARPTVCFSHPMDASRAAGWLVLELEGGDEAAGQSVAASGDAHCLTLNHEPLQASATYLVRALQGLRSADGELLATEVRSRFRTSAP